MQRIRPTYWTRFARICSYLLAAAKSQADFLLGGNLSILCSESHRPLRIKWLEFDNTMGLATFLPGEASQILSIMVDVLQKPFDHRAVEL